MRTPVNYTHVGRDEVAMSLLRRAGTFRAHVTVSAPPACRYARRFELVQNSLYAGGQIGPEPAGFAFSEDYKWRVST